MLDALRDVFNIGIGDLFSAGRFVMKWWLPLGLAAAVVILAPGVLPALARFFGETRIGRVLATTFLGAATLIFLGLSLREGGRASAYRDRLIDAEARLRVARPVPPTTKKPGRR